MMILTVAAMIMFHLESLRNVFVDNFDADNLFDVDDDDFDDYDDDLFHLEILTILRVCSEKRQTSPTSSNACSAFNGHFIYDFYNDY